jgi:membrane fusion protein (multidrug efflux system)
MTKRFIIVGILLAVVFGGLAVFQYVVKPKLIAQVMSGNKPPPVTVSATKAKLVPWQPTLTSVGTMEATRGVSVSPLVAGRVRSIHFKSGQQVTVGTLLVTLDDSIEQAQLKEAQSALKLAELDYQRGLELYQKQNYAKASLDKARAQRDQNEAKVESLRATIRQKKIHAPFTGRLGIRQVNLGQFLSPGTAIVPLQALDPIFVNFSLPETDVPKVQVGQTVILTVDGYPGETFRGRITSIDSEVNQSTRNILVQATLRNPGSKLVPGMFANVSVRYTDEVKRVTVPQTAIAYSLYGDSVFVIVTGKPEKEGGKPVMTVQRRAVKVGARRGDVIAVLSGLKAGETVATSGQIKLRNGARVTISNDVKLSPPKVRPKP